jgi:hypothetical protein
LALVGAGLIALILIYLKTRGEIETGLTLDYRPELANSIVESWLESDRLYVRLNSSNAGLTAIAFIQSRSDLKAWNGSYIEFSTSEDNVVFAGDRHIQCSGRLVAIAVAPRISLVFPEAIAVKEQFVDNLRIDRVGDSDVWVTDVLSGELVHQIRSHRLIVASAITDSGYMLRGFAFVTVPKLK